MDLLEAYDWIAHARQIEHQLTTALGYLTGAEYLALSGSSDFDGLSYNANDTLIKYTWYGDVNFDGFIDGLDYIFIDNGASSGLSGWANGDVTHDGVVDGIDYIFIDSAFINSGGGTQQLRRAIAYLDGTNPTLDGMNTPALEKLVEHVDDFGSAWASQMLQQLPEPASLGVIGLAAGALMGRRRRRAN